MACLRLDLIILLEVLGPAPRTATRAPTLHGMTMRYRKSHPSEEDRLWNHVHHNCHKPVSTVKRLSLV